MRRSSPLWSGARGSDCEMSDGGLEQLGDGGKQTSLLGSWDPERFEFQERDRNQVKTSRPGGCGDEFSRRKDMRTAEPGLTNLRRWLALLKSTSFA